MPSIPRDRAHRRLGRVARHRAGVAEAEVGVLVAVDVDDRRAARALAVEREAARPLAIHDIGTPASRLAARLLVQLARARVLALEALALAGDQLGELLALRGRHAGAGSAASSGSSGRTAAIFSARRCCHTVRIIIATVNRKIIVAIT